ncbi:MAG: type II 3-dehydroquinate dehydratase [Patescibacteria group bacterium]
MQAILLIHGPNLNLLGVRDSAQYGTITLSGLEKLVSAEALSLGFNVKTFQSNHEGALIDFIQTESANAKGIIINPGALTHYSYALRDALCDARLPCVEVHLSDISKREDWRKISVTADVCIAQVMGKKEAGYAEAVQLLHKHLLKKK